MMLKRSLMLFIYLCKISLFTSVHSKPFSSGHTAPPSQSFSDVSRHQVRKWRVDNRNSIRKLLMSQSKNLVRELNKSKYESYAEPLLQPCEFNVRTVNMNEWRSSTNVHHHLELMTTILDNFISSCSVKDSKRSRLLHILDIYTSNIYEYARRTKVKAERPESRRSEKHVDGSFQFTRFSFTKKCLRTLSSYCLSVIVSPLDQVTRLHAANKFYSTCSQIS